MAERLERDRRARGASRSTSLFEREPDRLAALTLRARRTSISTGRRRISTQRLLDAFVAARRSAWASPRRATPCSPARSSTRAKAGPPTHVAERGQGAPDDVDLAAARRQRMRALVDAIEGGRVRRHHRRPAHRHRRLGARAGAAGRRARPRRRPATTSASCRTSTARRSTKRSRRSIRRRRWSSPRRKTFTTAETLTNLDAALDWLREAGVDDPYGQVIAVTAAPEAAVEHGIDETRILPFGEGVGGRYSLWCVGRASRPRWRSAGTRSRNCSKARRRWTAISASPTAPPMSPLLAAFADLLYAQKLGCQTRARLRL